MHCACEQFSGRGELFFFFCWIHLKITRQNYAAVRRKFKVSLFFVWFVHCTTRGTTLMTAKKATWKLAMWQKARSKNKTTTCSTIEVADVLRGLRNNHSTIIINWEQTIHFSFSRFHFQTGISRLNYTPTSDLDYGTLSCWGRNAIGIQKSPCIFQVVAAGNFHFLSLSQFMIIIWLPRSVAAAHFSSLSSKNT